MTPPFAFRSEIESAVTEQECLKLYELAEGKVVLELGSQYGRSTVTLAQSALQVHAVDWFKGDAHAGDAYSLTPYLEYTSGCNNIVTHVGKFEDVLPYMKNASFDMVFVDCYHEYEATKWAGQQAHRLVKPGGSIVFHDYGLFDIAHVVDVMFPIHEIFGTLAVTYA